MERKNDAIGRTFTETKFVKDDKGQVSRVAVSNVERVYTVAGRYSRALSDAEVRGEYPPLRDHKTGKILPSVFPSVQTQSTGKGKRRAA